MAGTGEELTQGDEGSAPSAGATPAPKRDGRGGGKRDVTTSRDGGGQGVSGIGRG